MWKYFVNKKFTQLNMLSTSSNTFHNSRSICILICYSPVFNHLIIDEWGSNRDGMAYNVSWNIFEYQLVLKKRILARYYLIKLYVSVLLLRTLVNEAIGYLLVTSFSISCCDFSKSGLILKTNKMYNGALLKMRLAASDLDNLSSQG